MLTHLCTTLTLGLLTTFCSHSLAADAGTLFDFAGDKAGQPWRSVNDGVMGGRSTGRFTINDQDQLEFSGDLSLENNGGFASIRAAAMNTKLSDGDVIVARVMGDGRTYEFNLYTQRNLGGYSYRQSFKTKKGEWIEVKMPVDQFVATWRGREFPDQKFEPAKASGLGILLGDKKAGPFKLMIDWIKVRPADAKTDSQ